MTKMTPAQIKAAKHAAKREAAHRREREAARDRKARRDAKRRAEEEERAIAARGRRRGVRGKLWGW